MVMLAPPNQGSAAVDALSWIPGFDWLNGPAGRQLGKGAGSVPLRLGPANFELGVIAGSRSIDPLGSAVLDNPDDGKVSVEDTKLDGMTDFVVVKHSHAFIMRMHDTDRVDNPLPAQREIRPLKKVAYLTMADMGDFVTDFHLSFAPMAALGWQVETVDWRSDADWNLFDAVYICTPWDYPQYVDQFLQVLAAIDASRALLVNDLALVHWTLDKTYLRDIEGLGGDIVPSTWYDGFESTNPAQFFSEHDTDKVVIKPIVGANAKDTFRD